MFNVPQIEHQTPDLQLSCWAHRVTEFDTTWLVLSSLHPLTGADPGGSWGSGSFWGTPKLHKRGGKTSRVCTRKRRILVLNSYLDPPFPNSCIHPCLIVTFYDQQRLPRAYYHRPPQASYKEKQLVAFNVSSVYLTIPNCKKKEVMVSPRHCFLSTLSSSA